MYLIQHYVIKYVSDLRQVSGFLRVLWFPTNKTESHDITEILLKVAFNIIPSQSVPKTFRQTSPNSILEEFFLFDKANSMQFLLDRGIGLVVFGTDCHPPLIKTECRNQFSVIVNKKQISEIIQRANRQIFFNLVL